MVIKVSKITFLINLTSYRMTMAENLLSTTYLSIDEIDDIIGDYYGF